MATQLPLTPLPPVVLEAVARHDAAVERARRAAEATMIEAPDFDAQRATGTWPYHVWTEHYSPARAALFRVLSDHGLGERDCREDLTAIWSDRALTHLGMVSERWRVWFRAAWDAREGRKRMAGAGALFAPPAR
jgi:hypothetical protein